MFATRKIGFTQDEIDYLTTLTGNTCARDVDFSDRLYLRLKSFAVNPEQFVPQENTDRTTTFFIARSVQEMTYRGRRYEAPAGYRFKPGINLEDIFVPV